MPVYRTHQEEADRFGADVVAGKRKHRILTAEVIPGGGKTALALLYANRLLDAGVVDDFIWLAPRITLCDQVDEAWLKAKWANRGGYKSAVGDGQLPLYPRDAHGAIVTSQAFARSPDTYLQHMRTKRTLLIVDEVQMLCEDQGGQASRWADPIVTAVRDFAAHSLLMGGKLLRRRRTDRVPLVEYVGPDEAGEFHARADIAYGLKTAIGDRVIRPPVFPLQNANVTWDEESGSVSALLSEVEPESEWKALQTFLSMESTWRKVIDDAVAHWKEWQNVHTSRIVFVCADQDMARRVREYVQTKHRILSVLAVTDEGDAARKDLRNFRKIGRPEAIVTVAMVAIGFDAPDCTHMVYLSAYRSLPWVLQAFARVWRWQSDLSADIDQRAFVFTSDDPRMLRLVKWFQNESAIGVKRRMQREPGGGGGGGGEPSFTPRSAEPTNVRYATDKEEIGPELSSAIERTYKKVPASRAIPADVLRAILVAQNSPDNDEKENTESDSEKDVTRDQVRDELSKMSRKLDRLKQVKLNPEWRLGQTEQQMPRGFVRSAAQSELSERLALVLAEIERLRKLPDYAA